MSLCLRNTPNYRQNGEFLGTCFLSIIWFLATLCDTLIRIRENHQLLRLIPSFFESVSEYESVFRISVWIIIHEIFLLEKKKITPFNFFTIAFISYLFFPVILLLSEVRYSFKKVFAFLIFAFIVSNFRVRFQLSSELQNKWSFALRISSANVPYFLVDLVTFTKKTINSKSENRFENLTIVFSNYFETFLF